ncbi:MAG: hypothetical protein M9962_00425 [Oligoflexia bacterium]|nr:hypothetical protein [Oligoflexia bacterium]
MKPLILLIFVGLLPQASFADKISIPGNPGQAEGNIVFPNTSILNFDWTSTNRSPAPIFKTPEEAVVYYQNYREMMKKRTMANMVANFPVAENASCIRFHDAFGFNTPIEGDRYQFNCLAGRGDVITHVADFDMRASISSSNCPSDDSVRSHFQGDAARSAQGVEFFNQTMETSCTVSATYTYPSRPVERVQNLSLGQINSILQSRDDLRLMINQSDRVKLNPGTKRTTDKKTGKKVNPLTVEDVE